MSVIVEPRGGVTTPRGFLAGATYAGIKSYGEGKLDLALLYSEAPCTAAAVFTTSRFCAAAVTLDREHLRDQRAQAVVVNSGVANAGTGERGIADARRFAELAASRLGIRPEDVVVCSTGVIGEYLPLAKIESALPNVHLSAHGGEAFARAIMTTDTRPKHGSVSFGPYLLGGCAKGAGMIHPNMATMLAFLTTDAPVEAGFLQRALRAAVDRSFNLVSVDGDTSPSDTVVLLANGVAGGEPIDEESGWAEPFQAALEALCVELAKAIARDGEGATKLMEVTVTGAANEAEARHLVRLLTTSYLLKSAVHGSDPNWGRIVAVIGRSGVSFEERAVSVSICGTRVFTGGMPASCDLERVAEAMRGDHVTITVDLGAGTAQATGWGCDLSAEYVSINADYHT